MPSTSKSQHNFMAAVANNPAFAKKVGVSQAVGQDFNKADQGRKFKEGGDTMATKGVNPFAKFEKSKQDVEPKGMKEGSKEEEAMDKKEMAGMKKGTRKFAEGGSTDPDELETANAISTANESADPIASMNKSQKWTDTDDTPAPAPVKVATAPAKAKVVTKEELAKSGLSLRDYMNKQQGLTRRGGGAPSSAAPSSAAPSSAAPSKASSANTGSGGGRGPTAEELDAYSNRSGPAVSRTTLLKRGQAAADAQYEADAPIRQAKAAADSASASNRASNLSRSSMFGDASPSVSRTTMLKRGQDAEDAQAAQDEEADAPRRKAQAAADNASASNRARNLSRSSALSDSGFAAGGSVSRRGDGIASKGKTRGRMC